MEELNKWSVKKRQTTHAQHAAEWLHYTVIMTVLRLVRPIALIAPVRILV